MRKYLNHLFILTAIILISNKIIAQIQPDNSQSIIEKVQPTQTNNKKGAPMVIGAPLHNQFVGVSNRYIASVFHTYAELESFNTVIADDFEVPSGESWNIEYISMSVYLPLDYDNYNGMLVKFYHDDNGKPGTEIVELSGESIYNDYQPYVIEEIHDITIKLSTVVNINSAGKYWISIQAITDIEQDVSVGQLPGWRMGAMVQNGTITNGNQAHILSPGYGYHWYPEWTNMTTHWITEESSDLGIHNLNFALYSSAAENDLSLEEITYPIDGDLLHENEAIFKVRVQNHGTKNVAAGSYTMKYSINENWVSDPVSSESVPSGGEIEYNFRIPADISAEGIYDIEILAECASDPFSINNSIKKTIRNYGTIYPAVANSKVVYQACNGTFTDNGGLNYAESRTNDTVVFKPEAGKRIQIKFEELSRHANLLFKFYNGSSTNAPLIGQYWTREVPNLELNAANAEGAITIVLPKPTEDDGIDFVATINCLPMVDEEFIINSIEFSEPNGWVNQEIEITALLDNTGLSSNFTFATFFANDEEIGMVSSTNSNLGEISEAKLTWIPENTGNYNIKVTIPMDDSGIAEHKEYSAQYTVSEYGYLIEGFEKEIFPPFGWTSKQAGKSKLQTIPSNDWQYWEGRQNVRFYGDTLITPLLDITENDSLEFIISVGNGAFNAPHNIFYSNSLDGPWKLLRIISDPLVGTPYKISLKQAKGANYIGFFGSLGRIDYIRGPKLKQEEYDLEAINLDANYDYVVDSAADFKFQIRNIGLNNVLGADYTVELWFNSNGSITKIDSLPGIDIPYAHKRTFTFDKSFNAVDSNCTIYAKINYSGDLNNTNDASKEQIIRIFPKGTQFILNGSQASDLTLDFPLGANKSYAEIIYKKDEIGNKGIIYGISLFALGYSTTYSDLQLFIGETETENLNKQYLSTEKMFKVFDGKFQVPFTNNKFEQIYIEFEKPFIYSGEKNLAFAFYQPHAGMHKLQGSMSNDFVQRNMLLQPYDLTQLNFTDSVELNSFKPTGTSISSRNNFPNMLFHIKTTQMDASLGGIVKNIDNEPLAGTEMSLDKYINKTTVNELGYYSFPAMHYGEIGITAVNYGYYDSTQNATMIEGTNTVDFIMEELNHISVFGSVYSNDSLKPLSNVNVYLTGYNNTTVVDITNSEGKFELNNVYGDKTYEIIFSHPQFVSDTILVQVPYEGITIDSIIMDEIEHPAFNLTAIKNESGNVDLSWQKPYSGTDSEIDPTLGTEIYSYWYNEPDEDVQMGNYLRVENTATITSIDIKNFTWGTSQYSEVKPKVAELYIRFYNKDREEILDKISFLMPVDTTDWFTVDVPDFTVTDDIYIMVHWDRIHEQTAGLCSHQTADDVAWVLDANGKWEMLTNLHISGIDMSLHKGAFSIKANTIEANKKGSKALVNYNVYRASISEISDPNRWSLLTQTPITAGETQVTFADNNFTDLPEDYYIYMLESMYTLDTAPTVFSNDVIKGLMSKTSIKVEANNGLSTNGAIVELVNNNGSSINHYTLTVENDSVYFPRVRKGNYTIVANKGATYKPYNLNLEINNDTALTIELEEIIYSPDYINVEVLQDEELVVFNWALGATKYLVYDDNTFEKALSVQPDANGALGNLFELQAAGNIINVELLGIPADINENGKVKIVFYDFASKDYIGESATFVIEAIEDTWQTVEINNLTFNGPFLAMLTWDASEPLNTNGIGIDINSNPGAGYYWDQSTGFHTMASLGMFGNVALRTNVLINGKKSGVMPAITAGSDIEYESDILTNVNLSEPKSGKKSNNVFFNIYLEDLNNPIIEGLQTNTVTFNETHLTVPGKHVYTAGVQSVYATGKSSITAVNFVYTNQEVSINSELNASVSIYPNPANNQVSIKGVENCTIEFYNAIGTLVKTINSNSIEQVIDITNLEGGVYVIVIAKPEGNVFKQLIINR